MLMEEVNQALRRQEPLYRIHDFGEELAKDITGTVYSKYIEGQHVVKGKKVSPLPFSEIRYLTEISSFPEKKANVHLKTFLKNNNLIKIIDDTTRECTKTFIILGKIIQEV